MIGVDLVYLPEFQARLEAGGDTLLEKMFVLEELGDRSTEHLAGVWAAKEAIRKIISETPKQWTDIRLSCDPNGRPSARYQDVLYDISISHQGDYAVAVAMPQPMGKDVK